MGHKLQEHTLSGSASGLELLHVEQILLSGAGQFVADEVFFGDNGGGNLPIDLSFDSMHPGFIERYAIDALQNVDSFGGLPPSGRPCHL